MGADSGFELYDVDCCLFATSIGGGGIRRTNRLVEDTARYFESIGATNPVAADGGREQTAVDVEELEVKDEDDVRTDGGEDCEEADRC